MGRIDDVAADVRSVGDQLELWARAAETPVVGLTERARRRLLDLALGDRRLPPRFWAWVLVEPHDQLPSACWTWLGPRDPAGYGQTPHGGRMFKAHRLAWLALVGPIKKGLQLDHLCRRRACVRPAHLNPVPQRDNTLRGIGPTARNAQKTHCANGHPLSGANLRITTRGTRECVECRRAWNRKNMRRYRRERT
jgi:hypothetical protein